MKKNHLEGKLRQQHQVPLSLQVKRCPDQETKNYPQNSHIRQKQTPRLNKKFRNNLDKETMEKYCRFLLGAYEECMAKYGEMKERKVQENEEKQQRGQKTSTTSSTLIDTNEKVYVRI